ncbi:MAG TPA: alpha-amylase family glycosyl hydrolase [Flavisolibacter sp.]|jgi:glycosidase|nr:alpha-amylase family glycosyl hydrolase [Flavisolibacter sp.]
MRKISILIALFSLGIVSCNNGSDIKGTSADSAGKDSAQALTAAVDDHPDWIMQGNIYEVNTRQYTPEGTFKAFEPNLQRLKDMGVQTLWFMPITPISKTDRKGKLGSYYAVADYTAVNPEFGTMDDWKALVKKAHDMDFKVITDWVPNHSGGDNRWLTAHPNFYVKDSVTGKVVSPFDWTDTRKLNYKDPELVDSMIAAMKFWVRESDIDGFRCDVAGEVPREFWTRCIAELRQMKKVFMLAETNDAWVHEAGFDATYPWDVFQMTKLVAKGERPAFAIDSVLRKNDSLFTKGALRLYFTSNHDENSWNKADYGTMPGPIHAPFAVLSQTLVRGVPLIYSGQEEPFLDSVSFFYKDTITFGKYGRAAFYKTMLNLRKNNPALAADASFKKLATNNDAALYAFEREKNGHKVLVILNLSKNPQQFTWKEQPSAKEWNNIFLYHKEPVDKGFGIEPWGYAVYEL